MSGSASRLALVRRLAAHARAVPLTALLLSSITVVALPGGEPTAAAAGVTSRFVAATPCRLADARTGAGVERIDGQTIRVRVAGLCGVPSDATAVALTVTADSTVTPGAGYISIWPEGAPMPTASIVNYRAGEARANAAIVAIGVGGSVILYARNGAPVVVDVTGWFVASTASADGRFVPLPPTRASRHSRAAEIGTASRRRDDQRPAATRCAR